jgi:hypothetical protein
MLDHLDKLVYPVALRSGELDELTCTGNDRATLRRPGNGDAAAAPELEQPLVAQQAKRTENGVGVYVEHGGEVLRRREPLARLRLAVRDCTPNLGGHLLVEHGRLLAIHLDMKHGASQSNSTLIVMRA